MTVVGVYYYKKLYPTSPLSLYASCIHADRLSNSVPDFNINIIVQSITANLYNALFQGCSCETGMSCSHSHITGRRVRLEQRHPGSNFGCLLLRVPAAAAAWRDSVAVYGQQSGDFGWHGDSGHHDPPIARVRQD